MAESTLAGKPYREVGDLSGGLLDFLSSVKHIKTWFYHVLPEKETYSVFPCFVLPFILCCVFLLPRPYILCFVHPEDGCYFDGFVARLPECRVSFKTVLECLEHLGTASLT